MVDAPGIFDHPVLALPRQVAGAVQALACAERAGDETLGGERRATVVAARQADTSEVKLAGHAGADRVQFTVQHVGLQVGDRPADRHAVLPSSTQVQWVTSMAASVGP